MLGTKRKWLKVNAPTESYDLSVSTIKYNSRFQKSNLSKPISSKFYESRSVNTGYNFSWGLMSIFALGTPVSTLTAYHYKAMGWGLTPPIIKIPLLLLDLTMFGLKAYLIILHSREKKEAISRNKAIVKQRKAAKDIHKSKAGNNIDTPALNSDLGDNENFYTYSAYRSNYKSQYILQPPMGAEDYLESGYENRSDISSFQGNLGVNYQSFFQKKMSTSNDMLVETFMSSSPDSQEPKSLTELRDLIGDAIRNLPSQRRNWHDGSRFRMGDGSIYGGRLTNLYDHAGGSDGAEAAAVRKNIRH